MSLGEVVVWLPEPFDMGTGTITGINEIGWFEVSWHNGEVGAYCPNAIERAEDWERRQVEAAFG